MRKLIVLALILLPTASWAQIGPGTVNARQSGNWSVTCTNCSGSGATHIDNNAFTGSTDDVAPMGALYDTTPPTITDGNLGAPRMDVNRLLYARPYDGTNLMPMMDAAARAGFQKITDGTDTANVSAGGKLEVTCDNCGGSTFADNSAFTFGTTNIMPMGYVFDDASPNAVTENNAATPRMSGNRIPYAILRDGAGNERGANVNASNQLSVSIDNTPTITVGTFPDNEPFNLNQVGGTALAVPFDLDSGAGTQNILGVSLRKSASGGSVELGTSTDPVRVDPTGTTTQPISGTVTANAGTNLNTSALALESGGNLATIAGVVDATGTAVPANALFVGGTDGTNTRALKTDTSGELQVDVLTLPSVTIGTFPDNEPFNLAQVNGATTQVASNGLNTTGAGLLAGALVAQCDDTSPTALTENQFGHIRENCTTHHLLVEVGAALPTGDNNIGNVDVLTLPSVTIGTFPDNEPFNLAQVGGTTIVTGNGVTGAGSPRVTIASDNTAFTVNIGTFPDNEPVNLNQVGGSAVSTAAAGVQKVGVVGNANAAFDAASGAAPPANRLAIGGLTSGATAGLMVSPTICDSFVNVNVNTATTTLLVTGVSGRHVRICAISMGTSAANNVALISGTGATCGTGTTGMTGGVTAATGYNFAANGGIAYGTGIGEINRTNATGDSVCLVTSAATQVSGRLSYAIY